MHALYFMFQHHENINFVQLSHGEIMIEYNY